MAGKIQSLPTEKKDASFGSARRAAQALADELAPSESPRIANGMPLLDQVQKDMVAAMKAKDQLRLDAIRMIKTALTKAKVDSNKEFDEKAELQVLSSLLKQRREAADMFRQGGREESALQEEMEAGIIEAYMPSAPNEEELSSAIESAMAETGATSVKDLGTMMKAVQAKLAGKRVDGKALSDRVRSQLGA